MKLLKKISYVLLIIGGLNWGVVGLFQTDLVERIFGEMSFVGRLVYILVGLSALIVLITKCKCKSCEGGTNCCK